MQIIANNRCDLLSLHLWILPLIGGNEWRGCVHQHEDAVSQGIHIMDLHVIATIALFL